MLTNRGALKREFSQNIERSHRPAKGKQYLKSVKTNPYQFVGMVAENIFRLKDHLAIRILMKDKEMIIKGIELKPDRYEHGIPYLEKEEMPIGLMLEKNNYKEANQILYKLASDQASGIIEENPEEVEDDMMLELEKIILTSDNFNKSEQEEEDDEEKIIQQTLF